METVYTIEDLLKRLSAYPHQQIGFVPTMGFLHEGHLSLAKEAVKENDLVVMSIFVNPLQFGPNEDFDRYPRNEAADQQKAEQAGIDVLFIPTVKEIYPGPMTLSLTFTEGADVLCGRTRPGHFDGVATILTKLFHLINPDNVYFGLKDAQQFALVNTLIEQYNFQINLIGLPTVREVDGLAKSSRNVYLSDLEREEARLLHHCLERGRQSIAQGIVSPKQIEQNVSMDIQEKMTKAVIDYVELRAFPSLKEAGHEKEEMILAAAIQYKKARLLDNIILLPNGEKQAKIIVNHKTDNK